MKRILIEASICLVCIVISIICARCAKAVDAALEKFHERNEKIDDIDHDWLAQPLPDSVCNIFADDMDGNGYAVTSRGIASTMCMSDNDGVID